MIEKAGPPYYTASAQTVVLEPARCPVCKEPDRIEKVSSIVRQTSGQVVLPRSRRPSNFTTDLSDALRLPARFRPVSLVHSIASIVLSLSIAAAIVGLAELLEWQSLFEAPQRVLNVMKLTAVPWFGVLVPVIAAWRYLRDRHIARQAQSEWDWALNRWESMYYCFRDDVVFVPGENGVEAPERLLDFLRYAPGPMVTPVATPAAAEAG